MHACGDALYARSRAMPVLDRGGTVWGHTAGVAGRDHGPPAAESAGPGRVVLVAAWALAVPKRTIPSFGVAGNPASCRKPGLIVFGSDSLTLGVHMDPPYPPC